MSFCRPRSKPDYLVYWRYPPNDDLLVLCRIHPQEMDFLREKRPTSVGTPAYWCLDDDGDVRWFPDSLQGEPFVKVLYDPKTRRAT